MIKVFKQYFPNTEIDVITNGLILKKLSLSEIEQYNQYNVKISVSIYQDFISKIDYEILSNKFNNIQFFNRPIFYHFTIDKTASQKSFFERKDCVLVTIPCFTLLNYKIYICPFSAYLQFCDNDIKNYNFLDLMEDINFNDLIKFCNCEKQICKYCKFDCPVLWNLSDRCKEEYF